MGRIFRMAIWGALAVTLTACATSRPASEIDAGVWRQVDADIGIASQAARRLAGAYAQERMALWRQRVAARTETDFIPWFAGYWTQQWLSLKLTWYQLGSELPAQRLTIYLREQYRDRVLKPVAREIDPVQVREQATRLYLQALVRQISEIPQRRGIPKAAFEQRIKTVVAIAPLPPTAGVTLFDLANTGRPERLPAYAAMLVQFGKRDGGARTEENISPLAQQASEKLLARLALSGGSGVVSTLIGGTAGVAISLGGAVLGNVVRKKQNAEMEALLRECLQATFADLWNDLAENAETGVMAGVNHIAVRIEGRVGKPPVPAPDEENPP